MIAASDPYLQLTDCSTWPLGHPRMVHPVVGVFDSGVGGLSVVKEMLAQDLMCSLIYVADQANAPYGERDLQATATLAVGITRFFRQSGADVVVLACNTASAAALYELRRRFPGVPFVGMEPAIKPAAERSRTRRIGVIATAATLRGTPYAGVLRRYATDDLTVLTEACPEFVALAESGDVESDHARRTVALRLDPLVAAGIDQLVLGCTHYSFLKPLIQRIVGPTVEVIDPAAAVARQTGRVLTALVSAGPHACGADGHTFLTTADPKPFGTVLRTMLGLEVEPLGLTWRRGDPRTAQTVQ